MKNIFKTEHKISRLTVVFIQDCKYFTALSLEFHTYCWEVRCKSCWFFDGTVSVLPLLPRLLLKFSICIWVVSSFNFYFVARQYNILCIGLGWVHSISWICDLIYFRKFPIFFQILHVNLSSLCLSGISMAYTWDLFHVFLSICYHHDSVWFFSPYISVFLSFFLIVNALFIRI